MFPVCDKPNACDHLETVCVGLVRYVTLTTFSKQNILTAK